MADKPETGRDDADLRFRSVSPTVPALQQWFVREVLPLEATLMQFLRRSGRSKSDIDDLIQDVYVRVCEAASKQVPDPAKPFVFTVARNLLIDRLRREQVVPIETVEDLDALNVAIDAPGPDQTVIAREELRRIQSALDKLPRRAREALILRKVEGLSWKEIGLRMGIAERTVNRHLTDAMHALADQLYGEQPDPRRKP
jgi:RNA polymerase sigma-70 factor (ECF subfamily)